MNPLETALRRITRWGTYLGGVALVAAMLLQIGNIVGRFAHFVIPGSFETFEMLMTVPIGFGLVAAALHKGHVTVDLLLKRFPTGLRRAARIVAAFLSLAIWLAAAWAGGHLALENGLEEVTDILEYPVLPFRLIFVLCLLLFSLTYLLDLLRLFKGIPNR